MWTGASLTGMRVAAEPPPADCRNNLKGAIRRRRRGWDRDVEAAFMDMSCTQSPSVPSSSASFPLSRPRRTRSIVPPSPLRAPKLTIPRIRSYAPSVVPPEPINVPYWPVVRSSRPARRQAGGEPRCAPRARGVGPAASERGSPRRPGRRKHHDRTPPVIGHRFS